MTRDERQEVCIQKWKDAKGRGILELCTGFGSFNFVTRFLEYVSLNEYICTCKLILNFKINVESICFLISKMVKDI